VSPIKLRKKSSRRQGNLKATKHQQESQKARIGESGAVHGLPVISEDKSTTQSQAEPLQEATNRNSSIPVIPYTWKPAVSKPSSLENAVNKAANDIEESEENPRQVRKQVLRDLPPSTVDNANAILHLHEKRPTKLRVTSPHGHHALLADKREGHCKRTEEELATQAHSQPLPAKLTTTESALDMEREPIVRLQRQPSAKQPVLASEKALPASPPCALEIVLSDFDVFSDVEDDDGDVTDRDVLRGLEVAMRAAADNGFDTRLRQKTGLRLRRFLADLMAVGAVDFDVGLGLTEDQPARTRRAKERQGPGRGGKRTTRAGR
jgi:hypothetical protein